MTIQAVIFDAFGTLMKIQDGSHPYRQLMKIGKAQGRRSRPDDASVLMKSPITLTQAAAHLGITASPEQLSALETVLADEIAAIEAYPDGLEAVKLLQEQGIRIGVCSNLAFPYRQAVLRCYWILSHAGSIQIQQPQGLRDEIQQRLRAALELHEQVPMS